MAHTANSILTAEPSRVHTIRSLTSLLHTQAHTYLLTKPYALRSQPWLTTHLERLLSPTMPSAYQPPRLFGKAAMSEDLLLLLSSLLSYRIEVCRHATGYKDLIWPEYADCAGCDVEREVERWVGFDPAAESGSARVGTAKEAQRQKAARRQGRIMVVQEVVDRIEKAALFAKPPGKYAAANREAKGVVYLALVVLGCRDREGRKVEELIARLERVKHEICRANVYHPKCMVGYGGPGTKRMMK